MKKVRLIKSGTGYELPIIGLTIKQILFNGFTTIYFNDDEESWLDFHSEFKVDDSNQRSTVSPRDKQAFQLFFDLMTHSIVKAIGDNGYLFLTFSNGTKLTVEDGPYENWHYTKITISDNKKNCLHVHGGVGRIIF
jgi:Family of unknown function (DUF6188)